MVTIEDIKIRYEYLCERVYSYPDVEFKPTKAQRKIVDKFLLSCSDLSTNSLWQYLLFQFVNRGSQKSFRTPTIGWILGDKAVMKWKNRTVAQQRVLDVESQRYRFKDPRVNTVSELREEYKDEQRGRDFSTPQGYLRCVDFGGALYHRGKCFTCRYKYECEKQLKDE